MSIQEICEKQGVTLADVKSKRRKREIVIVRKQLFSTMYARGIKQTEISKHFNLSQSGVSRLITSYNLSI